MTCPAETICIRLADVGAITLFVLACVVCFVLIVVGIAAMKHSEAR